MLSLSWIIVFLVLWQGLGTCLSIPLLLFFRWDDKVYCTAASFFHCWLSLGLVVCPIIIIIIIIIPWEFSPSRLVDGFFTGVWVTISFSSLKDPSEYSGRSHNVLVCMLSACLLNSNSSCPVTKALGIVLSTTTSTGITLICMFQIIINYYHYYYYYYYYSWEIFSYQH